MALDQVRNQFESFLNPLSRSKRVTLLLALFVILVGMGFLLFQSSYRSWIVLKSGLDPTQSESMLKLLHQHRIPAHLETGGSILMVEQDKHDQALQLLDLPASQ
ncbi:uncharacterized protein METZ01_LOCUS349761 [marine metagenome]|uniref:Flagellar M-ring N-terminal domain-containing protein n=1 Tax=marine metagenome TaxID=408172 RepID=A0A382RIE2_9ZZZZ